MNFYVTGFSKGYTRQLFICFLVVCLLPTFSLAGWRSTDDDEADPNSWPSVHQSLEVSQDLFQMRLALEPALGLEGDRQTVIVRDDSLSSAELIRALRAEHIELLRKARDQNNNHEDLIRPPLLIFSAEEYLRAATLLSPSDERSHNGSLSGLFNNSTQMSASSFSDQDLTEMLQNMLASIKRELIPTVVYLDLRFFNLSRISEGQPADRTTYLLLNELFELMYENEVQNLKVLILTDSTKWKTLMSDEVLNQTFSWIEEIDDVLTFDMNRAVITDSCEGLFKSSIN